MFITELKTVCPRCDGKGFQAGISRMGIVETNAGGQCGQCGGRGFLLTEKGRDLVALLRPFIEDMFEEWSRTRGQGRARGGPAAGDQGVRES